MELLCFCKLLANFTFFLVELQSFLAYCNNIPFFLFNFITHCLWFVLGRCFHFSSTKLYWYQQDLKIDKTSSTLSQQFYSFLLVFHFHQMVVPPPFPFQFIIFVSFVTSILWVDLICIWKVKSLPLKCIHLLFVVFICWFLNKQSLCSNSCNM